MRRVFIISPIGAFLIVDSPLVEIIVNEVAINLWISIIMILDFKLTSRFSKSWLTDIWIISSSKPTTRVNLEGEYSLHSSSFANQRIAYTFRRYLTWGDWILASHWKFEKFLFSLCELIKHQGLWGALSRYWSHHFSLSWSHHSTLSYHILRYKVINYWGKYLHLVSLLVCW